MKILYLHGWHAGVGGTKPTCLARHGYEVLNPPLSDNDFDEAVRAAQEAFDEGEPDLVVGSSRGGAVAMNIAIGACPLLLLCPAWKNWGNATSITAGTLVLHGSEDEIIPFTDSEELVANSGLPAGALVAVRDNHRLGGSLPAMLSCVERLASRQAD